MMIKMIMIRAVWERERGKNKSHARMSTFMIWSNLLAIIFFSLSLMYLFRSFILPIKMMPLWCKHIHHFFFYFFNPASSYIQNYIEKQDSQRISWWWLSQKQNLLQLSVNPVWESCLGGGVTLSRGFMAVVHPLTWISGLSGRLFGLLWASEASGHASFQLTHPSLIVVIVMDGLGSKVCVAFLLLLKVVGMINDLFCIRLVSTARNQYPIFFVVLWAVIGRTVRGHNYTINQWKLMWWCRNYTWDLNESDS